MGKTLIIFLIAICFNLGYTLTNLEDNSLKHLANCNKYSVCSKQCQKIYSQMDDGH